MTSALLIAGGLAFLLWTATQARKPSPAGIALDRKLAELRARGEPLTDEALARRFPDPAPGRDAETVLRKVLSITPGSRPSTNLPVLGGPWPDRRAPINAGVMRDLEAYLPARRELLEAIPDDLSGVRFYSGWTNGWNNRTRMPLVQMRSLFQTLSLTALHAAERQDALAASETLRKGFALSRTMNDEDMVNAMIRVACVGLMRDAAEQALNRVPLSDEQLVALGSEVERQMADTLTNAMVVEKHMGVSFLDGVRIAQTNGSMPMVSVSSLWSWVQGHRGPVYRDEDYLLYLEVMDDRMSAFKLPGVARIKRNEELDLRYQTNIHSSTARLLMRYWSKAVRTQAESEAKIATLQAALAIERYRLAHHSELPGALEMLAPTFLPVAPRDPFGGQMLRFKKLPRGYIVYSIGADGVNNGGTERKSPAITNNYDVTFTVER